VKALEEEFGVQLFDRSRRLPAFTEAGKIVLAKSGEGRALCLITTLVVLQLARVTAPH